MSKTGTVRRYDPLLQHLYIDWDNGSRLALLIDAGDCACPAPRRLGAFVGPR
ncbi:hypothetical protein [Streptomyces sp. AA1529]|uniref:hypothetical protein n=1 Tax=Streptomyces sp. AA1529 TaxID=1203257 RepID=UPI003D72564F